MRFTSSARSARAPSTAARSDQAADLPGGHSLAIQVEAQVVRRLDRRGDAIPKQRRGREQDPVDLVAFGSPFAPGEPDLDPPDRSPVRLFRPALLVEERRQFLVELRPESFLVGRGCIQHVGGGGERVARPLGRPAQRIRSDVSEPEAVRVGRHPARPSEVAAGQPGHELRPNPVYALAFELLNHEGLGQRREDDDVTAARDRVGQLLGPRRQQEEHRVERRLLEDLQQRVGRGGRSRSASRMMKTLRPGSGGVRYAWCQTSSRIVSMWMSRPSGSTTNSFG